MAQVIDYNNALHAPRTPVVMETLREFTDIGPKVEVRLTGPSWCVDPRAIYQLGWDACNLSRNAIDERMRAERQQKP